MPLRVDYHQALRYCTLPGLAVPGCANKTTCSVCNEQQHDGLEGGGGDTHAPLPSPIPNSMNKCAPSAKSAFKTRTFVPLSQANLRNLIGLFVLKLQTNKQVPSRPNYNFITLHETKMLFVEILYSTCTRTFVICTNMYVLCYALYIIRFGGFPMHIPVLSCTTLYIIAYMYLLCFSCPPNTS